jgi:MFS family permease
VPIPLIDVLYFIVGLIVTTIIIYIAAYLMDERGIGKAFLAALIGYVVYYVFHVFISGLIGAIIGFIVWLVALRAIYGFGWFRAFIMAIITAILIFIVGLFLPVIHVG